MIDVVASEIAADCETEGKVFVSIAAGTLVSQLEEKLGQGTAIVRLMPNMPALVGFGMFGLFANANASTEQKQQAMVIAQSCGDCIEVREEGEVLNVHFLSAYASNFGYDHAQ